MGGSIDQSSFIMVPKPVLLEMCSASPLLESLYICHTWDSYAANVDDFASAVGSACPLLDRVEFPCSRSPAEDYQWYFSRLKCLRFKRRPTGPGGPIRWDKIELTLQTCVHATEVDFYYGATVSPRLVDLILAAPVAGRLKALDLTYVNGISPESILRFARGLEMLTDLNMPNEFNGESAFYHSLVQARPSIVRLKLGFDNKLDDEDLRIICHALRLEYLELSWADNLTDRAIDIILESPCTQTLRSVGVSYAPQFSSEDVLRLVRGCPELAQLKWDADDDALDRDVDGPNVDAVDALLKSRGGRASGAVAYE